MPQYIPPSPQQRQPGGGMQFPSPWNINEPTSILGLPFMTTGGVKNQLEERGFDLNSRSMGTQLARFLGVSLLPQTLQGIEQGNMLMPMRGRMAQRLANPGTKQASLDQFRNQAFTGAADASRQAGFAGAAAGAPSMGSSTGQMLFGQALGDVNAYQRYQQSPQYDMEMLQVMDLLQQIPNFSQMLAALGMPFPQPEQKNDLFAQLFGQAVGGFAGNPGLFRR